MQKMDVIFENIIALLVLPLIVGIAVAWYKMSNYSGIDYEGKYITYKKIRGVYSKIYIHDNEGIEKKYFMDSSILQYLKWFKRDKGTFPNQEHS